MGSKRIDDVSGSKPANISNRKTSQTSTRLVETIEDTNWMLGEMQIDLGHKSTQVVGLD